MTIKPPPGWDLRGYPEPPPDVLEAWERVNAWALRHRTYPGAGRLLVVAGPLPDFLDLDDALRLASSVLEAALASDPSRAASPHSSTQQAHLALIDEVVQDPPEALALVLAIVRRLYTTPEKPQRLPTNDPVSELQDE